jgi:hypothetical protein
MSQGQNIWFERDLILSKAFQELKTASAHKVLAIFFTKRQFEQIGRKGKGNWTIKNNGVIEFTYKEASQKYNLSASTFRNAVDVLMNKGFIDIATSSYGIYKAKTLYSISNRWRKYNTPDFELPQPRPKSVNRGFQKGNQLGRNCPQK